MAAEILVAQVENQAPAVEIVYSELPPDYMELSQEEKLVRDEAVRERQLAERLARLNALRFSGGRMSSTEEVVDIVANHIRLRRQWPECRECSATLQLLLQGAGVWLSQGRFGASAMHAASVMVQQMPQCSHAIEG